MKLDFYIKNKKNGYNLIDSSYINYNTNKLNVDDIRLFLVKLFKNTLFDDSIYTINLLQIKNKTGIKKTTLSVLFEYDKLINRNFNINKLIE